VTEPGEVRASDADRDEAAAAIGAHWTAGRLDEGELDRRIGAAYAARTRGELAELMRDLPAGARRAGPAKRRGRRFFLPGLAPFQERVEVVADRERAFDEALSTMVPSLGTAGYHLVASERPSMMRFAHHGSPSWAPLVALVTFGLGLIAFLIRVEHPLTVLFLELPGGGTRIVAFGEAPRGVRKAFAELRD
jgi:Domain of unknown function (DUF1707)